MEQNMEMGKAVLVKGIADSLSSLLGDTLTEVEYFILSYDVAFFDVNCPNQSAVLLILCTFESRRLLIRPTWESHRRTPGVAFAMECELHSADESLIPENSLLAALSANETDIWSSCINSPLVSIEVHELNGTPQAIVLRFPGTSIMIAIGFSDESLESLLVGDGDELLVFGGDSNEDYKQPLSKTWDLRKAFAESLFNPL